MNVKEVLDHIVKNFGPNHKIAEAQAAQLAKNIQIFQQSGKISSTFYCMATGRSMNYPNKVYQQSILKKYGGDVVKMYTSFVSRKGRTTSQLKSANIEVTDHDTKPKGLIAHERICILSDVMAIGIADKEKDLYKYRCRRWHNGELVCDEQRIW